MELIAIIESVRLGGSKSLMSAKEILGVGAGCCLPSLIFLVGHQVLADCHSQVDCLQGTRPHHDNHSGESSKGIIALILLLFRTKTEA